MVVMLTLDEHLRNLLAFRQSMGDELYQVKKTDKKVTEEKSKKDDAERH
jgi:hypothetical protein